MQKVTFGENKVISNKKNLDCPVATTISLIGNKWKLLIVRDLLGGTKRFGELRKSLTGISQRVLTETSAIWRVTDCLTAGFTRKFRPESNTALIKRDCLYDR